MATTERRRMAADTIAEAEQVRDELTAVLKAAGIVLPSLRIDPASCVGKAPPLIELSRCNLDTARKLTAVLKGAAS
ncbi:hypothetical protein AB0F96_04115 [Streptomyces sp. NPDC023998]|uniref:hypothetical protein n=1 Tax=Streptomyces sp. NPDC023998 TaxID=3154597 RepID=UPI0034037474